MNRRHVTPPRRARRHVLPPACCLLVLALLAGCGDKGYQIVSVSGRVTLDGQPLANAGVSFVPLAKDKENRNVGPGSLGKTDADGRFTLQTVSGERGAVPATHVVRLSTPAAQGESADPEGVRPKAAQARGTSRQASLPQSALDGSLRFTVPPEGTDQANFALVSQPAGTRPR